MSIEWLMIGVAAGGALGYWMGHVTASRKVSVLDALLQEKERTVSERLSSQESAFAQRLADQQQQWEARLKQQREESEALYQRMKTEFENLSNSIFKSKAEDFTRLNSEHLGHLLTPLNNKINEFKQQVEQVYSTEAKERFSLSERIKDLVELNNRLSEEANNLTRALKGDNKMQGNWGEMILEQLLQSAGMLEGKHYVRQEFLKDEAGNELLNEESGQKMQPDIIIRYPGEKEMIIDSKVSLTAYASYTAAQSKEEQAKWLKAHLQSVRQHVDELSKKDYSHYDVKAPDFVMMFIPMEGAYSLAVQSDNHLWEYAYNKKVVLMSPTNLISALRLSLDLWRREDQVKNVQEIISRGTMLYEKVAGFTDTLLGIGKSVETLQKDYDKALRQFSEGPGNIVRQAEQLRSLSLSPKKRISAKVIDK
ncbi:MAG: DNA recombination protein RmuC [Bacteroides sp.]|nr:DNA recombination protein RmuC [Bacteroides sp.]